MNLYKETMKMLNKTKQTKTEIAKQCDVSIRWVTYLSTGEKKDLSVSKVQRVHDYLAKQSA